MAAPGILGQQWRARYDRRRPECAPKSHMTSGAADTTFRGMFLIYFDTCSLNRPFDDQRQQRVRSETSAVLSILERVAAGEWALVGSAALDAEAFEISDPDRRSHVLAYLALGTVRVPAGGTQIMRAQALTARGFDIMDAVHIASAESARANVLLTTDDAMRRRARRLRPTIRVPVENPLAWLEEASR